MTPHVGGHDQHGVFKIHGASLAVGHPAVIQYLEEGVKDLGMGLLYLVKKDDGVGMASYGLGEVSPLIIAYISGRGAYQPCHGMLLHVFGHINSNHVLFIIKQELGQGPRELGLSYTCGAKEDE